MRLPRLRATGFAVLAGRRCEAAVRPAILGRFPPSLLISGTRDFALSSVVYTHSVLVDRGVEAELHVWEGVGHAFFYDLDLPESRAIYQVLTRCFDTHLGVEPGRRNRPQENYVPIGSSLMG